MGRPKTNRSAQKTLRLTERAQFAVKLFSPLAHQSGNAFISAAIETQIPSQAKKYEIDFAKLWHADESVRELRWYLLDDEYPFPEDHAQKRSFVLLHREFFYDELGGELVVNERRAKELHPSLDEWRAVEGDHWAPGRAMAERLRSRGLKAPVWPPEGEAS
jgi:hypothetical protein